MLTRTSAVTLVSNPSPDVSTHEWVATNVKSMNRTNKLSSVPFYAPNSTARRHQFRLVLLRGVVKGATEADDPIAIYLEYLPPSPSDDGAPLDHPNHCKVAVWCVRRGDTEEGKGAASSEAGKAGPLPRGSPHRYEETLFTYSATDRMAGFKELVPSGDLNDAAFVDPTAFNAMTIRVEITTNVATVADTVAKATDRWASSLWGSATSAFSALQTGIDALKAHVASTVDSREEGAASAAEEDGGHRALPWEELPAPWAKAGRPLADWAALITATIAEDEGTFTYGAARGLHPDEQVLMTQLGLNHRAITGAAGLFDFDRDVHEGLLGPEPIRRQRYRLVPRVLTDRTFWANYMWKVAALSTSPRPDQIQLLLSIVNAPPRTAAKPIGAKGGRAGGSGVGEGNALSGDEGRGPSPTAVAAIHSGPLDAAALGQLEADVAAAVRTAVEAVELLEDLVSDAADALLLTSALQSCEGSRARVAEVSARIEGALLAGAAASSANDGDSDRLLALRTGAAETSKRLNAAMRSANDLMKGGGGANQQQQQHHERDGANGGIGIDTNTSLEVPHASSAPATPLTSAPPRPTAAPPAPAAAAKGAAVVTTSHASASASTSAPAGRTVSGSGSDFFAGVVKSSVAKIEKIDAEAAANAIGEGASSAVDAVGSAVSAFAGFFSTASLVSAVAGAPTMAAPLAAPPSASPSVCTSEAAQPEAEPVAEETATAELFVEVTNEEVDEAAADEAPVTVEPSVDEVTAEEEPAATAEEEPAAAEEEPTATAEEEPAAAEEEPAAAEEEPTATAEEEPAAAEEEPTATAEEEPAVEEAEEPAAAEVLATAEESVVEEAQADSLATNSAVEVSADEATGHKSDGEFVVVGGAARASAAADASPAPAVPPPAPTTATATAASKGRDVSKGLDFLDDEFEAFASPKAASTSAAPSAVRPSAAPAAAAPSKIEFEPMPWDDDDE